MDKKKIKTSTILLCLFLFIFFVILRFPYNNLKGTIFGKIRDYTGIILIAEDLYPTFLGWPGLVAKRVDASIPIGKSDFNLSGDKLIIRVGLASLIPPTPAVSLKLKSLEKGGNVYIRVAQSKAAMTAQVEATKVNLEQLKFPILPAAMNGFLSTESTLDINSSDFSKSFGFLILEGDELKLPTFFIQMSSAYGFSIPGMNLGDLAAKIQIRNGVVEFNEFKFGSTASDIQGSLGGDIKLGRTLEDSSINLTLRLKLADAYKNNPQSATLVSFLKSFENSSGYGMRCRASIRDIEERYACAIPEKVE